MEGLSRDPIQTLLDQGAAHCNGHRPDLQAGLDAFQQAREQAIRAKRLDHALSACSSIACIKWTTGKTGEAEPFFLEADTYGRQISQPSGDQCKRIATCWLRLTHIYQADSGRCHQVGTFLKERAELLERWMHSYPPVHSICGQLLTNAWPNTEHEPLIPLLSDNSRYSQLAFQIAGRLKSSPPPPEGPFENRIQCLADRSSATVVHYTWLAGDQGFNVMTSVASPGVQKVAHNILKLPHECIGGFPPPKLRAESGGGPESTHTNDSLIQQAAKDLIKPLANWYCWIFDAIAHHIPSDARHLVFVPHQQLMSVPFAALPDSQGRPLIEKYTVSVVPSLHIWETLIRLKGELSVRPANDLLIVTNPLSPLGEKANLKGGSKETDAVKSFYGSSIPLGENTATIDSISSAISNANTIHMICHAANLRWNQDPGALSIKGSAADRWEVEAIQQCALNAELTYLASCATAWGKHSQEEGGLINVAYAFLWAGSRTVVPNLWDSVDTHAAELSEGFHRHARTTFQDHPLRWACALRQTILNLGLQNRPVCWGGMSVFGLPG